MRTRSTLRRLATAGAAAVTLGSAVAVLTPQAALAVPAGTNHIILWNEAIRYAFTRTDEAPGPLTRKAAMLNTAMYDAVVSLTGSGRPYLARVARQPNYTYDVVQNIDAAARRILPQVFPTVDFTPYYTEAAKYKPIGTPGPEGYSVSVGQATAQAVLNARAADHAGDPMPYTPGTEPGDWRPTGSGAALTPGWGLVTPWTLTAGTQFRPPPPGGFTTKAALLASKLYADQVKEVKDLGAVNSALRTDDQTRIAFFWANDVAGTYKPPGQLLRHTALIATDRNLDTGPSARLFTLVALAMADAAIVAWDAKYRTDIDLWRPESAIRLAGTDGNDLTVADPAWQPLSVTRSGVRFSPPFPAYTSGHATFAGAWSGVMQRYFGTDTMALRLDSVDPNENTFRTYPSFSAAAYENARSRVYLGVHYQFDADAGLTSGDRVAGQAVTRLS